MFLRRAIPPLKIAQKSAGGSRGWGWRSLIYEPLSLRYALRSASWVNCSCVLPYFFLAQALLSLEARDHRHMTLLMHAASVGPAPVFHEVQEAIISSMQDDEVR